MDLECWAYSVIGIYMYSSFRPNLNTIDLNWVNGLFKHLLQRQLLKLYKPEKDEKILREYAKSWKYIVTRNNVGPKKDPNRGYKGSKTQNKSQKKPNMNGVWTDAVLVHFNSTRRHWINPRIISPLLEYD